METLQRRVETWIKDQRSKILRVTWPPPWRAVVKWPWSDGRREQEKKIKEELEHRKKQLQEFCFAVKADSLSDLQEILCCMVLSECVYKRPAAEMIRAVNKFKADFGGQLVSLERVQPSSDHVPHRYLLAEAGDTLFASFIGTKQYKDVMADANIFQGAIFHDDAMASVSGIESAELDNEMNGESFSKSTEAKPKQANLYPKPAVHRGFMARAKGIPALELYRLAQKKRRKLVLCGHSLGGAVAVLATLAILRIIGVASKESERVHVKCITFSQPPVGNAALRDYVNGKGWQHYFKTYCIPEDLVPRILSPAYFHHYNAQSTGVSADIETSPLISKSKEGLEKQKAERTEGEQLVLGVGPVQNSFWRLSRLVPIEGVRRQIYKFKGRKVDPVETSVVSDTGLTSSIDDIVAGPQSLEIEEGSDGISLRPLPGKKDEISGDMENGKSSGKSNGNSGDKRVWRSIPSLPSYVPFGQLFLLGSSSVESLSGSEYSKLTSVSSVIAEVRELFQSHSMKSYRSRFQRIFELYMNENAFSFLGREQELQFPHLQKWLGISVAGTIELGHIVESPVIRAATSLLPLGWNGTPGEKNSDPLKVDISGFGLHLCTLVQARVNGNWCSTTVEHFPSPPAYSQHQELQPEMQKMRILVGGPLKRPPKHQILEDKLISVYPSIDQTCVDLKFNQNAPAKEGKSTVPDTLSDFLVLCTTDFSTVAKEVHVRTRRVRLVGLEGAGKSSLLKAILDQGRAARYKNLEAFHMDTDVLEGVAGGLFYADVAGVNLQSLNMEASLFRDELWKGIRDLSKKIDLVVLVHNLSHRIPRYGQSNASQPPALSLLMDEAKSLGIPWVLAITNKFSVSAHQQKAAINAVVQAYQATPSITEVINSCPYVMPSAAGASLPWNETDRDTDKIGGQKLIFAPLNLVRRPFQKKPSVLPVEGVTALCQLVHCVLRNNEEASLQELARDRLFFELAKERAAAGDALRDSQAKSNSLSAATVGASVGAGVGIILAVVMGAASALRKP